jgi:hypothetical protein
VRAVAEIAIPGPSESASGTSRRVAVQQILASADYFNVLGLDVMAGRAFTPAERSLDTSVAVVSDTAARELWPGRSAIGQVIRVQPLPSDTPDPPAAVRSFTIVGIVRDVNGPLAPDFFPSWGVYVPASPETPGTAFTLRVRGDPDQARQVLVEDLTRIDPGLGQVSTMRTVAGMQTYILRIVFWVAVVLGGLALVLTVSGLFSVLSYVVEQRMREFGVRTALGATRARIGVLVLRQCARPVAIGILIGAGVTAGFAGLLLATPAAEAIGSTVRVLDPLAYASAVLAVLAACACAALVPALRAGRIDPVVALRQD